MSPIVSTVPVDPDTLGHGTLRHSMKHTIHSRILVIGLSVASETPGTERVGRLYWVGEANFAAGHNT
jgi:hypothetical protein